VINEIGKAQMIVNIWGVNVKVAFGAMILKTWFESGPPFNWRIAQLVEQWLLTDRLQVQVLLAHTYKMIFGM
jgi:hypothetical protein